MANLSERARNARKSDILEIDNLTNSLEAKKRRIVKLQIFTFRENTLHVVHVSLEYWSLSIKLLPPPFPSKIAIT
jgi:hypothetical protein